MLTRIYAPLQIDTYSIFPHTPLHTHPHTYSHIYTHVYIPPHTDPHTHGSAFLLQGSQRISSRILSVKRVSARCISLIYSSTASSQFRVLEFSLF